MHNFLKIGLKWKNNPDPSTSHAPRALGASFQLSTFRFSIVGNTLFIQTNVGFFSLNIIYWLPVSIFMMI